MSEKFLSQDEVDALLGEVESGDVGTGSYWEGQPLRQYNFVAQDRVIRGKMRGLEMANDRFTRLFSTSLSSAIMKFIDVRISNVELTAFGEFMKTVSLPASLNIFKMPPLKGLALFAVEAPMVFALAESILGDGARPNARRGEGYFTPSEQRVMKKIAVMALKDMADAWESLAPIRPEYVGLEVNPKFAAIVTAAEAVIRIDAEVDVEDFTGRCFFCFPYSMLKPIKDRLYSPSDRQGADQEWVSSLGEALKESYVTLSVEVGRAELPLAEIMNLKVGNVIALGSPVSEGFLVKVEDVPKLTGVPCSLRGSQGIKINKVL
jgi:flagellar motor switch protein FliM